MLLEDFFMRLTNLYDQEYTKPTPQAGDVIEIQLPNDTVVETTIAGVDREGNILVHLDETAINMVEQQGMLTESIHPVDAVLLESADSPVANALTRRIMHSRIDLLSKYGPESVMNAIDSVADWVGDVDEIGSSDVSAWIRSVERELGHEQGIGEARKANTASARAELNKRHRKVDPAQQAQRKQEEDKAWALLQQHMNKKQGVGEGAEDAFVSALKGLKTWQVVIMNNYYRGKYSDYSGRYYYVLATSKDEARQVVLDNADDILKDLLSMKSVNGKKILPRGSAIAITDKRIGDIKDGTEAGRMTTAGYKKMFGPQGPMMVKLSGGAVVDVKDHEASVTEAANNIGSKIKQIYKQIYRMGDDAVEFAYYDSPIFAQYWDEYEGDLDSIIAEVDPSELQIILDELEAALENQGLDEAAPAAVRWGAGAALGTLAGTGGVIMGSMLGGIFAPIVGGYAGWNGAKLGMQAADDIWDWAAKKLGGSEEDFAFAHIRAAAAGKDNFEFKGKSYPVTLPKTDVNKAIKAVKSVAESKISEAKYHGREVSLGKPVRGGPKKFYVYVRDPATKNIKKVNFGDPNMSIKKHSPKHRKSFRARHNCSNPGPRTKARYWSCRAW